MSLQGERLAAPVITDPQIEQVLLGLADGSYVLSTPDGAVAESGAGVVRLLGVPAERLVGQPIADVLVAGATDAQRRDFEALRRAPRVDPAMLPSFAARCAEGRTRRLQFTVVAVPLALGWEFTSLLTELRARDAGSWHPEALRLRHGHALEAVEGVVRNGVQPDPDARLAGILILVRDVDAPALTHEDVDRRMAEQRAAAREAAAEAQRQADEAAGRFIEDGDPAGPHAPRLEDLVERARVLRARVEEAERVAAEAHLQREQALLTLSEIQAERDSARARAAALEASGDGRAEQLERERDEVRAQLEALSVQLDPLRAQADAARAAADAARDALGVARSEALAGRTEADRSRAELESARADAERLRVELQAIRDAAHEERTADSENADAELAAVRAEAEAAHTDADSLRAELHSTRAELLAARGESSLARGEASAIRAELNAAREALQNTRTALEAGAGELRESRAQLVERDEALQAARAELAARTSELAAAHIEHAAHDATIAEARAELDARDAALTELRAELAAHGEQLAALRAEAADARAQADSRASALDAARAELERTQAELQASLAAADDVRAEREQAQVRARALLGEAEQARAAAEAIRAEFAFDPIVNDAPAVPGRPPLQRTPWTVPAPAPRSAPPAAARPALPAVAQGQAAALIALDGSFKRLDDAFCSLLGCREEDLRVVRWPSIIDRENLEAHRELARQLQAGEIQRAEVETVYMHAGGLLVPIAGTVSMHRADPAGPPTHFLFTADVSRTAGVR